MVNAAAVLHRHAPLESAHAVFFYPGLSPGGAIPGWLYLAALLATDSQKIF
jgi:hypothetical protein